MRLLFTVLLILTITPNVFSQERTIVTGTDLPAIKQEILRNRWHLLKELTFKPALVANLSEEAKNRLKRRFSNISFETDIIFSIDGRGGRTPPPQPSQTIPWGITRIKTIDAQLITRGAGVTVCVVDTGVDNTHPDLQANIIGGINTINPRKSFADDNGHGTHVSGTIAAVDNVIGVIGVAPDAKIFAAKGLDRTGSGWSSDLAEAIYACINSGTNIISMSWGSSSPSQTIHDALIDAYNGGLILVAAAGNEGGPVGYPAAFPEVLAVSATDSSDQFAWFSNYGPEIAFAAPGVAILSTFKGGEYRTWDGTSMATPHVAGVAALMIASGSLGLLGEDIGLALELQGGGLIDAAATVANR